MRLPLTLALVLLSAVPLRRAQARIVPVDSPAALAAAIGAAQPGDEIVLADGVYELHGNHGVNCITAGTASAPIVVRAARDGGAKIISTAVEAFLVAAPNWRFEGIDIRGACASDAQCEHAFHVVGRATGFQLLRSRLADFNAQLKVNADADHHTPDDGIVAGNEFIDTHPRETSAPVTPVDIDDASGWIVRGNMIRDFHKEGGNGVTYGAFVKGGAQHPVFEQNLVLCADEDLAGGTRIGLSFGGGGMDPALCAPGWSASVACDPEVSEGIIRNNIVANCSDDGIYLNRARDTKILYNTLIATGGVEFRFESSTGEAVGNVLSSTIRTRDGGRFTGSDNLTGIGPAQFALWYEDPLHGDLRRKGDLRALLRKGPPRHDVARDYCGRPRSGRLDLGAVQESAGDCRMARGRVDSP